VDDLIAECLTFNKGHRNGTTLGSAGNESLRMASLLLKLFVVSAATGFD
jgi:hypothetical protein